MTETDTNFLWQALRCAEKGEGHTRPNPPVGAVIVRNGKIIGESLDDKAHRKLALRYLDEMENGNA